MDTFNSFLFPTMICFVLAYLICGIPFGLLIARASGIDVRRTGSGNIGATNVGRTVGKGAAGLTLACDLGKGFICTFFAPHLISFLQGCTVDTLAVETPLGLCITLVYLACILGHIFSPYLGLRGGKGISVGFGALLGLKPLMAPILLLIFFIAALPTRYVSLGSVCAAISLPILSLIVGFSLEAFVPMLVSCLIVLWAHRANVNALIQGKERRFSFNNTKGASHDE